MLQVFLTTETSDTLDNLYEENFYIDPESVQVGDNKVKVLLYQVNTNNAEKKINDCLNFYKSEYKDKTIECSILINQNIAVEKDCVLISGEFTKKEEKYKTITFTPIIIEAMAKAVKDFPYDKRF